MAGGIAVEWMNGPWRDDTKRPPFLSVLGLGSLVLGFPLGLGGSGMFVLAFFVSHDWSVSWNGDPVAGFGWLASAGVLGVIATLGAFRLMFGGARSMAVVASLAWLTWGAFFGATTGVLRPLGLGIVASVLVVGAVLLDRIPDQQPEVIVRRTTRRRGRRR